MMLLDTCVVSEITKPQPEQSVIRWYEDTPDEQMYLSVLTIGEIAKGCRRLAEGPKRQRLEAWLADLRAEYAGRILPGDDDVALVWGSISAAAEQQGRRLHAVDGLIAATAKRHGFAVATRNEADFTASGAQLINPWRV